MVGRISRMPKYEEYRVFHLKMVLTQSACSCSWSYSWKRSQTWLEWRYSAWVGQVGQDFACNPGNNDGPSPPSSSIRRWDFRDGPPHVLTIVTHPRHLPRSGCSFWARNLLWCNPNCKDT